MSLDVGAKLGPHEILSPIGAGGIGVVNRAKDMRLDREVAIKVLPDIFLAILSAALSFNARPRHLR